MKYFTFKGCLLGFAALLLGQKDMALALVGSLVSSAVDAAASLRRLKPTIE